MLSLIKTLTPLLLLALPLTATAQDDPHCSLDLRNAFGPFDYRTAPQDQRDLVETAHFTPQVEHLVRGNTATIGADIAYTLRAFPNHPRGLIAMAKLARKEKRSIPSGSRFSPDCWFKRALLFQPDDGGVYLAYGIELLRDGKVADSIEKLKRAEELIGENANILYNLGLAYFEKGDHGKALTYAHQAYKLGFPLPGLRNMLERAGAWRDQ